MSYRSNKWGTRRIFLILAGTFLTAGVFWPTWETARTIGAAILTAALVFSLLAVCSSPRSNTGRNSTVLYAIGFANVLMVVGTAVWAVYFRPTRVNHYLCISNLTQLSTGLSLYAEDSGGRYPPAAWMDEILPYIKSEDMYRCPADEKGRYSYALAKGRPGTPISVNSTPLPVAFDAAGNRRNSVSTLTGLVERHHEKGNVLLSDGGVKPFTRVELILLHQRKSGSR